MAAISTILQLALSGPVDVAPGAGALLAAVAFVYFLDVAPVYPHAIAPGIVLSEKTIPYALLLQISTASRGSMLAGACGLVSELPERYVCTSDSHTCSAHWRYIQDVPSRTGFSRHICETGRRYFRAVARVIAAGEPQTCACLTTWLNVVDLERCPAACIAKGPAGFSDRCSARRPLSHVCLVPANCALQVYMLLQHGAKRGAGVVPLVSGVLSGAGDAGACCESWRFPGRGRHASRGPRQHMIRGE